MKKLLLFLFILSSTIAYADPFGGGSGFKSSADAKDVKTKTIYFNGNLSTSDTDVQKALDTLDDLVAGGGTPGGSDTQVQYNDGGAFGGDAGLTYNETTDILTARIGPRVNTTASSATPSINTDTTDIFTITALATAITSMTSGLSGTPVNGQNLVVRILDNGTARAITWGASFASRGVTLPTTTVLSKYLRVLLEWNSTTSTWDCIAVAQEG